MGIMDIVYGVLIAGGSVSFIFTIYVSYNLYIHYQRSGRK